jgi:mannose-6-phosphate isomerase-like protein (cupin superfamily)
MSEVILSGRSNLLRKNQNQKLKISFDRDNLQDIFLINGSHFITTQISKSDLKINSNDYYMTINTGKKTLKISYDQDITNHTIIYNPYKYEFSEKTNFKEEFFKQNYNIPNGYVDTLPKWYSFKFTYPDYNLIFIRPEMGLSIQKHKYRNETWEVLDGNPIILTGNKIYYFVEKGTKIENPKETYHSIINPNKDSNKFVILKERWSGYFDENDIERVFNPNRYE